MKVYKLVLEHNEIADKRYGQCFVRQETIQYSCNKDELEILAENLNKTNEGSFGCYKVVEV